MFGHATQRASQQAGAYITDCCIIEVAECVVGVSHHPFGILLLESLRAVPDVDGHAPDRQRQQGATGQQQADEVHQAPAQCDDRLRIHFLGRHAVGIGLGDQRFDFGQIIDEEQVIVHRRGFHMRAQAPFVQKALHLVGRKQWQALCHVRFQPRLLAQGAQQFAGCAKAAPGPAVRGIRGVQHACLGLVGGAIEQQHALQGVAHDVQLPNRDRVARYRGTQGIVRLVQHCAYPAVTMLERVIAEMPGIARFDRFCAHARQVYPAVCGLAPLARPGADELGVQVLGITVTHVQFPDHVLHIVRRERGGQRTPPGVDDARGKPVVGVEPWQVLQRQLLERVAFLDHLHHLIAHALHAGIGQIGGGGEGMHDSAGAAGADDTDLNFARVRVVAQVMAQALAQACIGPGQQAVALLEIIEAQHSGGCRPLGGCHQLLHSLHDMAQALRGGVAQPVWQVLFQQLRVACLHAGFGTDFVPKRHGPTQAGVLVGCVTAPQTGFSQALALGLDHAVDLGFQQAVGVPVIAQAL
ncbi:hypothetical protein D3C76_784010 [compost metagenome]